MSDLKLHGPGANDGLVDDYEVWIDTEGCDFDGTCLGCGETREAAVKDAREELLRHLALLDAWLPIAAGMPLGVVRPRRVLLEP